MAESLPVQKFTDYSVDELFAKFPVTALRSLHGTNTSSVKKAKDDLRSLVGDKYRDLIRIAEDIDSMHTMSKKIDENLTDLSYKPLSHTPFNSNPHSRFERAVRLQRSQAARSKSQGTILNNIINNKLIAFDLKLRSPAPKKSLTLVHMAKVYHTISVVFRETLSPKFPSGQHFHLLKSYFVSYLEDRIASITPSDATGLQMQENLFVSSKHQWLEPENVDFLADLIDEADQEDLSDNETGGPSRADSYTSPMVNYLVAYIIVQSADDLDLDMQQIATRFIDLRYSFLEKLIRDALLRNSGLSLNFNFSVVLTFLESTYSYIHSYLLEGGSNDVQQILRRSSLWRLSDFIGFHNWFEEENVTLQIDNFRPISKSYAQHIDDKLVGFSSIVRDALVQIIDEADKKDSLTQMTLILSLFHNFVASSRKLEVLALSESQPSIVGDLFSKSDLATEMLEITSSKLNAVLARHSRFLADEIIKQVMRDFQVPHLDSSSTSELFTKEFVDLIDEDVDFYFRKVLALSTSNSIKARSTVFASMSAVRSWFNDQIAGINLILNHTNNLVHKTCSVLEKAYRDIALFSNWGTFTTKAFESRLQSLKSSAEGAAKARVSELVTVIFQEAKKCITSKDIDKVFFALDMIVTVKETGSSLSLDDDFRSEMDSNLADIYREILFSLILSPTDSVIDMIINGSVTSAEFEDESLTRPHPVVHSALQKASSMLIKIPGFTQDEVHNLYVNRNVRDFFVNAKNDWILQTLIDQSLKTLQELHSEKPADLRSSADETGVTDTDVGSESQQVKHEVTDHVSANGVEKLSAASSRQVLANLCFLAHFRTNDILKREDPAIQSLISAINAYSVSQIEASVADRVLRDVYEFYKSSKVIYLPLLTN